VWWGARSWSDPAGSGRLAERDKVPSRKKIKTLDLTRRRVDDVQRKERTMRRKKKPQWFRHDEGNPRELKSQLEWKISLIVRQRVATLEKKIASLEKNLHDVASIVDANTEFLASRLKGIHEVLTPMTVPKRIRVLEPAKKRSPRKKAEK
jgi:hypothetical protein